MISFGGNLLVFFVGVEFVVGVNRSGGAVLRDERRVDLEG